MIPSEQTTVDLKSIIETLDQRIHELNTQSDMATHEVGQLNALRQQTANLISAA